MAQTLGKNLLHATLSQKQKKNSTTSVEIQECSQLCFACNSRFATFFSIQLHACNCFCGQFPGLQVTAFRGVVGTGSACPHTSGPNNTLQGRERILIDALRKVFVQIEMQLQSASKAGLLSFSRLSSRVKHHYLSYFDD
jgi:hypothetical protein